MARPPTFIRLLNEKFGEQQPWISELLQSINTFMEQTTNAFNKNINFDNISGDLRTISVDGVYPKYISWDLNVSPKAVCIGQCRESEGANHTTLTVAPYIDWEYTGDGRIKINNITSISPTQDAQFDITLIIFT